VTRRPFALVPARRLIGLLALLLAGVYAVDTWQTLSFGRWHKPGAAILPIGVAALLAMSGIAVLLERQANDAPSTFSLPTGADLRRLLLVLAAFAIYFLAMPLVGNMIASALFLFATMWLLSDDRGRPILRIALYAVAIAVIFELFFVRLLKVQMPAGLFRQWLF
jgi:hypothetical protein